MPGLPLRNPFVPGTPEVASRAWALYVNTVAASPLLTRPARVRIYRRCGITVDTDLIYPRCYFHSAHLHIGTDALVNHGVHIENVAPVRIGARTALAQFATVLTSRHE